MSQKLTIKQKKFADGYIISGNATESYKLAGYKYSNSNVAGVEGFKLLKNPKIKSYIEEKLKAIDDAKIMDLTEALQRTTSIARREIQKGYSKKTNLLTGEVLRHDEYEFMPSIEEAQTSLEHIIRCNGGFVDRQELDMDMELKIQVDYGDD